MNTDPDRSWSGNDLARQLHVKPRNMLTQLAEWSRWGFFTRTGHGSYAPNTPHPSTCQTTDKDP
jgi:hypothetical protein